MRRALSIPTLALAVLLGLGGQAQAQDGKFSIEGFFGYYDPDSVDGDAEIGGGRFGYRPSDDFGMLLSAGAIDLEDEFLGVDDADLRFDLFLVDLSFQWYPSGGNFYLFAGPGWATIDLEVDVPGANNDIEASEDVFTINGGLGYMWKIGDSFFVRPEAKARYFDGADFAGDQIDSYEGLDTEYSIALGWRFGG